MKRFITIFLLSVFALTLQAQVTGGQGIRVAAKTKPSNDVFRNYSNFQFHFSKPLGQFGEEVDISLINPSLVNTFGDQLGKGVGLGIGVHIGQSFYLNKLNIAQDSRLGFEATYIDVVYQLPKTYNTSIGDVKSLAGTISAGLGLSYNYNPIGNVIVGAKYSLLPTIFNYERTYTYTDNYNNDNEVEYIGWATMLRSSVGIFVRSNPFYVGFDISFGTKEDMTIKDSYTSSTLPDMSFQAKTTRFDVVVGFSF